MLIKGDCCLIGLSTIGHGSSNYFNVLLSSKRFKIYRLTYVCPDCEELGLVFKACRHRIDSVPEWNSADNFEVIQELQGGDKSFQIESLGLMPKDSDSEVFPQYLIQKFFASPHVSILRAIRTITFGIDPSSGSVDADSKRGSNFTVIAIGNPGNIFLGGEAIDASDPSEYKSRLIDLVTNIRNHPLTAAATIVLAVENNLGMEAGHIRQLITSHFHNVVTMDDKERKAGRRTTHEGKEDMVRLLLNFMKEGEFSFWEHFHTSYPDGVKGFKDEFKKEMEAFSRVVSERPNGLNRAFYSGKGNGKRDDLILALMILVKARKDFMHDPKYAVHHRMTMTRI